MEHGSALIAQGETRSSCHDIPGYYGQLVYIMLDVTSMQFDLWY